MKKGNTLKEKLLTERMLSAALWRAMGEEKDGGLKHWRVAQFVGAMYHGNDFDDFLCELIRTRNELPHGVSHLYVSGFAASIAPVSRKILNHRARKVARYPKK